MVPTLQTFQINQEANRNHHGVKDSLAGLWVFSITLIPIYIGESGGMQPCHLMLLITSFLSFLKNGMKSDAFVFTAAILLCYMILHDLLEMLIFGSIGSLKNTSFFIFNIFVAINLRSYLYKFYESKSIVVGLWLSITVCVLGLLFSQQVGGVFGGARNTGTFNNPNQLGYFSVCAASAFTLLKERQLLSWRLAFSGVLICSLISAASLSKGALIANAVVFAYFVFGSRGSLIKMLIGFSGILISLVIASHLLDSPVLDDMPFVQRLRLIGADNDDSMEVRGYGLLLSSDPKAILFGYGVDGMRKDLGHEVHSTIASVFVVYGILGGGLFLFLLEQWFVETARNNKNVFSAMAITAPVMLYGLVHNGSRFTLFWILVAVCLSPNRHVRSEV